MALHSSRSSEFHVRHGYSTRKVLFGLLVCQFVAVTIIAVAEYYYLKAQFAELVPAAEVQSVSKVPTKKYHIYM